MNCSCGNEVSERAAAECRRLNIQRQCSRCICEHIRECRRPLDAYQAGRQTIVLRLVKRLAPYQLELFEGWKRRCVRLGVPLTPEEKYSYLSDLLAA